MKIQVKLSLYNAISKVVIILAFGAIIPILIQKVAYNHLDRRLVARLEKTMRMVAVGGLDEIALDQDCSFDSYNIFKEEFVSIAPIAVLPPDFGRYHIENAERKIDDEIIKHRVLTQAFVYDNQLYSIDIGEGLNAYDQLNVTIRKFTIWIMVAVVVISIFFDLLFARLLLRPFNKIVNEKLRDVQHPSTFDPLPVKTTTTEFSHLDKSINEMMVKIRETFETERQFIMNVSHEILTPISILKNRIENMISDPGIPDAVVERMVDSQKTLSRLTKVVRNLLYISKIENAQYVKNESADLQMIVREIFEELEELTQGKGITIVNEWKDDFVFSPCNLSLIHTMLFNLITNAIKYNCEEGKITVTGMWEGEHYVVKVYDTGDGISSNQLPYIFDRFKRFRPEDDMSYGLGLPIVKTIADFHGIKVSAESTLNQGSCFTLRFPGSGVG
ncbi:MAG: HAMP domain-containing histidine kinase [Bacteroidetes bacterium]|nr:HAMP domain-containing histidine kinase [Bacteroidota bacterium]MBK8362616.1 HAMP domain-containing histidine kinase [Bacteroidota bacterium]